MRAKTKITYNRDGSVKKIVSNVGQTHHNRAAYELHCNNVKPTFSIRLRWFFKNLHKAINDCAEAHLNDTPPAAAMPYIGIEDVSL